MAEKIPKEVCAHDTMAVQFQSSIFCSTVRMNIKESEEASVLLSVMLGKVLESLPDRCTLPLPLPFPLPHPVLWPLPLLPAFLFLSSWSFFSVPFVFVFFLFPLFSAASLLHVPFTFVLILLVASLSPLLTSSFLGACFLSTVSFVLYSNALAYFGMSCVDFPF